MADLADRLIRVLVVEDEAHIAKFLQFVLKKGGYDARVAYSGEEALTLVSEYSPDAIILDLGLPGISGLDVLRELRSNAETSRLAICVLTASSVEHLAEEVTEAGASAYCTKPVAPSRLLQKLHELGFPPRTPTVEVRQLENESRQRDLSS